MYLDEEPKFKLPRDRVRHKTSMKKVPEKSYDCVVSDMVLAALRNRYILTTEIINHQTLNRHDCCL